MLLLAHYARSAAITIEFDYAKRDFHLAYGGVALQQFVYGNATIVHKSQLCLYFVNKINLPCCCVVFFVVFQLLRPIYINAITASYRFVGFHC